MPNSQVIRWTYAFIDRPAERFGQACTFWTAVTGTRLSEFRGERGEFVTLLADGADACLKAQGVDEGPGGAHLDLAVEDVAGLVKNAVRLGASVVAEHEGWAVLRSPGGQLFCAVPFHGEQVRPPLVAGPDGSYSRLDQVCIDLAPSAYDTEVAFWTALTGWESRPGSLPEFHVVMPGPELPVRILLQRLGADRQASAHLDLACSDIEATRAWHEQHGATFVAEGTQWTVMRDPAGGIYCLTGRDPRTGGLPG
ncbi:VOC family protein [Streptomyces jeddahensis]|uniref:Glyoxalase-like domain protein n=1 Tax=Streptomyces jeddahensis TaxID=1716141 RepID=A0A177HTS2_9ACTN|nr:VOC family protein [Streptomyces jeddahensis]OAH13538.1 glyoxalase-like domain protein [Streptomyces jeddahensis]